MNKDLSPRKLHFLDNIHHLKEKSLYYIDNETNEKRILYDADNEIAKKYPNLHFLCDGFDDLYKNEEKKHYIWIEFILNEIIKLDDVNNFDEDYFSKNPASTIAKWYTGNLDKQGISHNNNRFLNFLKDSEKEFSMTCSQNENPGFYI